MIKITRSTYRSGPNAGKKVITRHVSKKDGTYSVQVVKTNGAKGFAVSWASTAVIEGLKLEVALNIADKIVNELSSPKIDLMREIATG